MAWQAGVRSSPRLHASGCSLRWSATSPRSTTQGSRRRLARWRAPLPNRPRLVRASAPRPSAAQVLQPELDPRRDGLGPAAEPEPLRYVVDLGDHLDRDLV